VAKIVTALIHSPLAFNPQPKVKAMNIRAILCAASLAGALAAMQPAFAQPGLKVGALRCDVAAGLGLIITSSKEMSSIFMSAYGPPEHYFGMIRKFGLDIGATDQGVLAWDVFASTQGPPPGALAGEYIGGGASATVGAGLGANALVGGLQRSFTLQPLSIEAQTGLDVSAGVTSMILRFAP
jgi:Protein of unknown function (DUF992)